MTEKKKNNFIAELKRRNVFRVAIAYLAVSWLLIQVAETIFPLFEFPDSAARTIVILAALLFVPTMIFSWFFELTAGGFVRDSEVDHEVVSSTQAARTFDYAIIGLLSVALIYFVSTHDWSEQDLTDASGFPDNSVAVLPFVNMSGNPANEYFSDGLTEMLLHALAQLPDLKVPARTSSFYFEGQDADIRKIAEQLQVSKVLEGSVQRDGDRVRIVAQLIEAKTGYHLWSQSYDREMSDIFALQDDIVTSVALAMKATFAVRAGDGKIQTVSTDNVAAYENFLKGLEQKYISSNASLLQAEISFKLALAQDPDFYEARLELASTYAGQIGVGEITRAEGHERMFPLLDRLLERQPYNGRALALDGRARRAQEIDTFDVENHLAELIAAIERTPNEPELFGWVASLLRSANRREEAFAWVNRGLVVDPLNWSLHFQRASHLLNTGDLESAESAYAKAIELNPGNPSVYGNAQLVPWFRKEFTKWFVLMKKGMEVGPLDYEFPATFAAYFYTFGLVDEGDKYLQRAIAIAPSHPYVDMTKLYRFVILDDRVQARDLSESMLRSGIENRRAAYWRAEMVFLSTMSEMDKADEALAVFEELKSGVTSSDFVVRTADDHALQYHAILALTQLQSAGETQKMLDTIVRRWDESFPTWRDSPGDVAPIAMARGRTEIAVELALKHLESTDGLLEIARYRHINYYKALAQQPAVAKRLKELEAEARKAGAEISAYIEANDLQL